MSLPALLAATLNPVGFAEWVSGSDGSVRGRPSSVSIVAPLTGSNVSAARSTSGYTGGTRLFRDVCSVGIVAGVAGTETSKHSSLPTTVRLASKF